MIQPGDRIDVVLDVVAEDDTYRVVMSGVPRPDEPLCHVARSGRLSPDERARSRAQVGK
ncbi:hypothetical protein [Streptomyces sp. NPDC002619]|uniref:hypothetical protein n=1 Tax=Streptomyces sp. NPDC002619 TaxID=3364655 RepID=UPI0036AE7F30